MYAVANVQRGDKTSYSLFVRSKEALPAYGPIFNFASPGSHHTSLDYLSTVKNGINMGYSLYHTGLLHSGTQVYGRFSLCNVFFTCCRLGAAAYLHRRVTRHTSFPYKDWSHQALQYHEL